MELKGDFMDLNLIIILVLCAVILIILIVMYLKDKEVERKLNRIDHILTEVMQENFVLKKEFVQIQELVNNMEVGGFDEHINETIDEKILPIYNSIQAIKELLRRK